MKLNKAITEAIKIAKQNKIAMAIVSEGVHADEFAERDEDGESYGYCPAAAISTLYKHGKVIKLIPVKCYE